jgi:hypothetical protein
MSSPLQWTFASSPHFSRGAVGDEAPRFYLHTCRFSDKTLPPKLISKAKINVDKYWFVITTEECYIHCSNHILAHTEIEKRLKEKN